MTLLPGTIDLGKFRVVYEEERRCSLDTADGYFLQQRAIIRLNEELVKIEQCEDYTVYCDDAQIQKRSRHSPVAVAILYCDPRFLHVQPAQAAGNPL